MYFALVKIGYFFICHLAETVSASQFHFAFSGPDFSLGKSVCSSIELKRTRVI